MAKKTFRKGDVVQIDWGDAWSTNGWVDTSKKECEPFDVTQVGSVVKANKEGIMFTLGFASDGDATGVFFVPKGMIRQAKLLIPSSKIKVWKKKK